MHELMLLVTGEIQIKNTMNHHFILTRLATLKKGKEFLVHMWQNWNAQILLVGM